MSMCVCAPDQDPVNTYVNFQFTDQQPRRPVEPSSGPRFPVVSKYYAETHRRRFAWSSLRAERRPAREPMTEWPFGIQIDVDNANTEEDGSVIRR